ncbi:tyrosine-protein kinase SRK2-like isoform X2 [Lineus longissimus]|uniref:tyrosine-protein kinase SRK2-like isoform X2 n=1 Tax=Lineus longissimus TaxID=88925 RepID=UPI002B4D82CB
MGNSSCKFCRKTKPPHQAPNPSPLPDPDPQPGPIINTQDVAVEVEPQVLIRALYTYQAQNPDDLSFQKGDKMVLLEDSENMDWWYARHLKRPDEVGYIPSNYVQKEDGKPESHECWFNLSRREADKSLLLPGNPPGTYIARPCSQPNLYALSVRDFDQNKQIWVVRHYKIRPLDGQRGYFIAAKKKFASFDELIAHYSTVADGLCCCLSQPCPRYYRPPVHFKEMIQKKEAFQLDKKLGHGSFGEVYQGKWNRSVEVAIKTLKEGTMTTKAFLQEARTMHTLNHPHILPLLAVCTESEPLYIITELMRDGSLLDYLRNEEKGQNVNLSIVIDMAAQIADGMEYLEQQNYVHRDLRAANILVGENYMVKVADFGLAQLTYTGDEASQENSVAKFPIKWTAPEAASDKKSFTVKSDVWSFGVLLYEMVSLGRLPYPGMDNNTALREVKMGYRMPRPVYGKIECPENLYDTMLKCWDQDPANRPTFNYLKMYFDDFFVAAEASYQPTH